jgi:CheY-like chemotaxis protein
MYAGQSSYSCTAPQGRRVLVVEDEALVAMMLEDGLLDAGAEIVGPARSVSEALAMIERTASDGGLSVAVLDINLEGAAVFPVADCLAARGVPFVFCTGYGDGCDRGTHVAAPVLAKPFGPDALVAAVESLAPGTPRCTRDSALGPATPSARDASRLVWRT